MRYGNSVPLFFLENHILLKLNIKEVPYYGRNNRFLIQSYWGGGYLYPITLTSAVYDLEGTLLSDILSTMNNNIEGKQEAGDYASASHNHDSIYAKLNHTHAISDITNLQSTLDGKASSNHTHAIANITNLQSTLDGKQPKGDYAAASHTHAYLPLTGGTITGDLKLDPRGYYITTNGANGGTGGFYLFARIKITDAYQNSPITFILTERGQPGQMYLSVGFSNSSTSDPELYYFRYRGINYGAYIRKNTTSIWDIYVRKEEAWGGLLCDGIHGAHSHQFSISYPGTAVTSLPSGYTAAAPFIHSSLDSYNYRFEGNNGRISAVQSGSPNDGMLWAW